MVPMPARIFGVLLMLDWRLGQRGVMDVSTGAFFPTWPHTALDVLRYPMFEFNDLHDSTLVCVGACTNAPGTRLEANPANLAKGFPGHPFPFTAEYELLLLGDGIVT